MTAPQTHDDARALGPLPDDAAREVARILAAPNPDEVTP